MGREDVRAVGALYCLVLCLVVAQMGWGFGMSFWCWCAYLVDVWEISCDASFSLLGGCGLRNCVRKAGRC